MSSSPTNNSPSRASIQNLSVQIPEEPKQPVTAAKVIKIWEAKMQQELLELVEVQEQQAIRLKQRLTPEELQHLPKLQRQQQEALILRHHLNAKRRPVRVQETPQEEKKAAPSTSSSSSQAETVKQESWDEYFASAPLISSSSSSSSSQGDIVNKESWDEYFSSASKEASTSSTSSSSSSDVDDMPEMNLPSSSI